MKITPSVFADPRGARPCHSFVTDGRIQFLTDSWHSLKGQTVDLPVVTEEPEYR